MRYVGLIIFIVCLIGHIYILKSERKAAVKRVAYRWLMIVFGLSFLTLTALTVESLWLMVFVIPVVAMVVFLSLKFTKFCDWCGKGVRTNLPFVDKATCSRCGSTIR